VLLCFDCYNCSSIIYIELRLRLVWDERLQRERERDVSSK
jgi:hypothetical protein